MTPDSWLMTFNSILTCHHFLKPLMSVEPTSGESQENALKTILCPIEASRAAIQVVPKLQLTGFPVDFLQHVRDLNHWTAARGGSMQFSAIQLRQGVVFKAVWSSENIVERSPICLTFSKIPSATILNKPKLTIPSVKNHGPSGRSSYPPIQTVKLCSWMNQWCWNAISASSNPTGLRLSVFHPGAIVNLCYARPWLSMMHFLRQLNVEPNCV